MSRFDRTRIGFFIILGLASLALIVPPIFIEDSPPPTLANPSITGQGDEPAATQVPASARSSDEDIPITIWTNDTKATWMHQATELFNRRRFTLDGQRIVAEVVQMDSGEMGTRLLETDEDGELGPTIISPGTIAWVNEANDLWKDLHQGQSVVGEECPPLAYAPIGFGMWQSMAEAMGWPDAPIGWKEIVELADDPRGWSRYGHPEWGQFKFGHTDPHTSNTGLAAMTSFVYASLGMTDGLTPDLVRSRQVLEAFEKLELNTFHYGSSTRSLNVSTATRGPSYLHAMASSENSILATNFYQRDLLVQPIVFIFPREGAFWSENPFCELDAPWLTSDQSEAAQVYLDFLLSREAQELTVHGWLRPVNLEHLPEALPEEWRNTDATVTTEDVPELATSNSGEVTSAVQDVFNQAKKRATIVVVLDRSQSMAEQRKLSAAADATIAFLNELDRDDKIQVLIFDDNVISLRDLATAGTVIESLSQQLEGIWAQGNTALHDAVCRAKQVAEQEKELDRANGENRLYGIILLSDGDDTNSSSSESEMLSSCVPRTESADVVKIFTIAYGDDSDKSLLERIANRTNGKAYEADAETIGEILQEIVWEQ